MAINLLRIFIFVPFHIKTVNIFQNKEECQMDKNEAIIRYAMQHGKLDDLKVWLLNGGSVNEYFTSHKQNIKLVIKEKSFSVTAKEAADIVEGMMPIEFSRQDFVNLYFKLSEEKQEELYDEVFSYYPQVIRTKKNPSSKEILDAVKRAHYIYFPDNFYDILSDDDLAECLLYDESMMHNVPENRWNSELAILFSKKLADKEKELSSDEIIETSLPADIGTWIEDKKANLSDMLTAFSEQCLKCTSIKASMKEVKDQLKKAKDEVTEFYKALKSLLDNIKTLRKEYDIADFTKEFDLIVEKEKKREEYEEQIKALRLKISELEKSKEDINKRKNSLLQELTKCQAEEKQRVDEKKSLCEQFPDNFNESEDYQSALKTTESEKNILTEKYENWKKSEQEVQASLQKVSGSLQTQENCLKSSQEKQREAYAVYLKELERLGLSPDFDVEKNLMEEDKKQSLLEKVNSYKESLKDIDTQKTYLKGKIKDQTFDEKEWKDLIEALSTSKESLLNYRKKIAVYESQSTDIQKRLAQKDEINAKYQQIIHRRSIIRELEELFKGNAFIEYVAESRLRYIAKEASSILSHISNGNYTLDVNDATEFVIRDNKNGGVLRAADTLSGGEIFITSLSLALALSSSIQLNGSAPLELFFLDEGFGSLDDELLNIVMDSLERIKTDRRSIGIISHVENLKERVPVKLLIEPSQNTGSGSHIRVQYS